MENKHLADYLHEIQVAIATEGDMPSEFLEFGAAWGTPAYGISRLCEHLKGLVAAGKTRMQIGVPVAAAPTPQRCPPTCNSFIEVSLEIRMYAISVPGPDAEIGWISHLVDSEAIAVILPFKPWNKHTFTPAQNYARN